MLRDFEAKKVIVGDGDATMRPRATTLSFGGRPSQGRTRSPVISDENMAWLLVDAVQSCLTGYERTVVFVELGCGEGYLVIMRVLETLLSTRTTLPKAILTRLAGWLNGYAGNPEEPQLRMMLAVIRLQQPDAL